MTTLVQAYRPLTARVSRAHERLVALNPTVVVAGFVVAQWAVVLGLAQVVRHNRWVYYQGGDQLWYYTLGWLLAHGRLGQPLVGYLWSGLLAPVSLVAGPDLANAYPAILLLDVVVLLPIAITALFGLAQLIAGRTFAYFTLLLWVVVPLLGITFTNAGYHQRYTELILPQGLGLTAMADFPAMVAAIVAAYFTARVLFDGRDERLDAITAGVAAGAAIAIKPSAALFLAGPLIALTVARRYGSLVPFAAGLAPAVLTLSLWKWRGYGHLPLFHSAIATRSAAGSRSIAAAHVPHYVHFDWTHFTRELDLLREHFWSGRILEWLVIAGLIAIGRRSGRGLALVGGWFAAFALVKGGYSSASIEDSSLLRILIPAAPAFVLLLASLPFLVPRTRSWLSAEPSMRAPRRLRIATLAAGIAISAVVPFAAIAVASPLSGRPNAAIIQAPLIPVEVDLGVSARAARGAVTLSWLPQTPAGGAVFYHVFRTPARDAAFSCPPGSPAERCTFSAVDLGTTRAASFVDRHARRGRWEYRIGVAANWLDDPTYGDVYVLSRAVSATVP